MANKVAKNRESRKDEVLARAIADGSIAKAQAKAEADPFGHNLASSADTSQALLQAHLEFFTHLLNDGVKHEGVEWLGNGNPYVGIMLELAKEKGLKVTEQNIIARFANEGAVDIQAVTESNGNEMDQLNDASIAPFADGIMKGGV